MAKFLGVRGSVPAGRLIEAGSKGLRIPVGKLPPSIWFATLKNSLVTSEGVGTFARSTTASYRTDAGLIDYVAINEPRYQSGGLMIEPDCTNYLAENNDIAGGSTWINGFFGEYRPQTITAPDGSSDASECFADDAFSATTYQDLPSAADFVAAELVTISAYVKPLGTCPNEWFRITWRDRASANTFQWFNIVTKTVGPATGAAAVTNAEITEADSNGWMRVSFTTVNAGSSVAPRITLSQSNTTASLTTTATTQGNGQAWWGAQAETGQAWASSVIRNTTTAKLLREQDEPNLPGMPIGYNKTLGALSLKVKRLADSSRVDGITLIWGAEVNASYLLIGVDGSPPGFGPNYQSNPGAGGDSIVSHQVPSVADSICLTFDASGVPTFPGTKRFFYINGAKFARANYSGNDDTFTAWPTATENLLGTSFFGKAFQPAFPCVVSNMAWWPELTDAQARKVSLQ
jgi:hypothetical protein